MMGVSVCIGSLLPLDLVGGCGSPTPPASSRQKGAEIRPKQHPSTQYTADMGKNRLPAVEDLRGWLGCVLFEV